MGLDSVELLLAIEEEFGIDIENDLAEKIETVGELLDCVMKKLQSSSVQPDEEMVFQRLKLVFYQQQRLKPEKIIRSARIAKDLGID
jgi:acyl carrier protein